MPKSDGMASKARDGMGSGKRKRTASAQQRILRRVAVATGLLGIAWYLFVVSVELFYFIRVQEGTKEKSRAVFFNVLFLLLALLLYSLLLCGAWRSAPGLVHTWLCGALLLGLAHSIFHTGTLACRMDHRNSLRAMAEKGLMDGGSNGSRHEVYDVMHCLRRSYHSSGDEDRRCWCDCHECRQSCSLAQLGVRRADFDAEEDEDLPEQFSTRWTRTERQAKPQRATARNKGGGGGGGNSVHPWSPQYNVILVLLVFQLMGMGVFAQLYWLTYLYFKSIGGNCGCDVREDDDYDDDDAARAAAASYRPKMDQSWRVKPMFGLLEGRFLRDMEKRCQDPTSQ